jgi:predicted DNA-binding protein (MmcQ/YjbR family)
MIDIQTIRDLMLSFPETEELPHFEKVSFRVKKKIFATYDEKQNQVSVKLSESDQDIFSLFDSTVVFPVPNKWGKQGWTIINLSAIKIELFTEILKVAFNEVAPQKLRIEL